MTSHLPQRGRLAGQSRRSSLLEALLNTLIGFWISVLANLFLLPIWGFKVSLVQSIEIGIVFTLVSILRSYGLRRAFNYFHISREHS